MVLARREFNIAFSLLRGRYTASVYLPRQYLRAAFVKIGLRPDAADDTDDFNPTKNILRHSACTYLHLLHGAATAARWAGHSEKIQEEHYIGLRDEDEAKRWIALSPEAVRKPEKVDEHDDSPPAMASCNHS